MPELEGFIIVIMLGVICVKLSVPESSFVQLLWAVGGRHHNDPVSAGGWQAVEFHQELSLQSPGRLMLARRSLAKQRVHFVHEDYRWLSKVLQMKLYVVIVTVHMEFCKYKFFIGFQIKNFKYHKCNLSQSHIST